MNETYMTNNERAALIELQAKKIAENLREMQRHSHAVSIGGRTLMVYARGEAGFSGSSCQAIMDDITSLRRDLLALRKRLEDML